MEPCPCNPFKLSTCLFARLFWLYKQTFIISFFFIIITIISVGKAESQTIHFDSIYGGHIGFRHVSADRYHMYLHLVMDSGVTTPAKMDTSIVFSSADGSNRIIKKESIWKLTTNYFRPAHPCDTTVNRPPLQMVNYFVARSYTDQDTSGWIISFKGAKRKNTQNISSSTDNINLYISWSGLVLAKNGISYNTNYNNPPFVLNPMQLAQEITCDQTTKALSNNFTDFDGDSMAFALNAPKSGFNLLPGSTSPVSSPFIDPNTKFSPTSWQPGYSNLVQIPGINANEHFDIDEVTGEISFIPDTPEGLYTVGVWIKEYRDIDNDGTKELIGSVFVDMIITVSDCISDPYPLVVSLNSGHPNSLCQNEFLLRTNFSGNTNYQHKWYLGYPSNGNAPISLDSTLLISGYDSASFWYYVEVINKNDTCDIGIQSTFIIFKGMNTNISSTGPNTIICNPSGGGLSTGFPTLTLDSSSNYSNHSFQWNFTNDNGHTSQVPFASTNQLIAKHPGDFFLVTTDLSTGCLDTSNVITITSAYAQEPFTLSLSGDTAYCPGEPLNNTFVISPTINQPKSPPYYTFEVYNGNTNTGSTLSSINGDGNYWVIITNPAGCIYYTDTLLVDIDTLPLPTDTIQITSSTANDIYCQYSGIQITNSSYPSSATHTLFINGISQGTIFDASGIHNLSLTITGWNDVVVLSTLGNGCFDTTINYRAYVVPEGCCSGISSMELLYGEIDPQFVYDQNYLVVEDLNTAVQRYYELRGDFHFMGDAYHYDSPTKGGEATGPNINLNDSVTMRIQVSSFVAQCDTMWGGIQLNKEATLIYEGNYMQDSYKGIRPDQDFNDAPIQDDANIYQGYNNEFHNNYISVSYYNIKDLPGSADVIFGEFSCETTDMLFPYDYASNEAYSSSYKAIDIYQGSSNSVHSIFPKNWTYGDVSGSYSVDSMIYISDHVYGVYFNENAHIDTLALTWVIRPKVAGIYAAENVDQLVLGYDSIELKSWTTADWQQEAEYDFLGVDTKLFGVYMDNWELRMEGVTVTGDGNSFAVSEPLNHSIGVSSNAITSADSIGLRLLDYGYQLREGSTGLSLLESRMEENVIAIHIPQDVNTDISMNCTNFVKSSNTDFFQYGIYVEAGGAITDDIGGSGAVFPPAGNGWPADSTNGYPDSTNGGSAPNVFNWDPPIRWYSIYDANADEETSGVGWNYWRYQNEWLGEDSTKHWGTDAVYPSELVRVAAQSQNPPSYPCIRVLDIPFPLSRIAGGFGRSFSKGNIRLFPNPADRTVTLSSSYDKADLASCQVLNSMGIVMAEFELEESGETQLDVSALSSGMYLIKVMYADGTVLEIQKLMIE